MDTETESRILDSLHSVFKGRTSVVIAHRVSAVMHCTEIIVLDEGEIVERGTHAELIMREGLYASLYEKQQLADAVGAQAN